MSLKINTNIYLLKLYTIYFTISTQVSRCPRLRFVGLRSDVFHGKGGCNIHILFLFYCNHLREVKIFTLSNVMITIIDISLYRPFLFIQCLIPDSICSTYLSELLPCLIFEVFTFAFMRYFYRRF